MSKLLSIVIPAYNEEENIINTAQTVLSIMDREQIPCELVFVSDGSKDQTLSVIKGFMARLSFISLSIKITSLGA